MGNKAKTVPILFSVAMMLVTVFAIISFTYAWYNRITHAAITTITMSTSQSEGILLSGNGSDWSPTLTTDGSIASIDIDQNLLVNSISSSATVVNGNMQFYTGEFSGNTFSTILLTNSDLYYVFDIYILNNDAYAKKLTLGMDSSVTDLSDKDVELSTRVAFLNFGYATNSEDAIALDGTGISSVDYIWEPNSTTRNDKIDLYHSSYLAEGKEPYDGVNMPATGLTLVDNLVTDVLGTPQQEAVEVTTYDPISAGESNDITLLMPEAITKIRIYIWSEGQDIDSTNSISGGAANINFSFNSYDVALVGQDYVAIEKFNTPTIVNDVAAHYTWSATTTNLSATTYSENYIIKLARYVGGELTPIRTVFTTATSLDIDELAALEVGQYYVNVKVYSEIYGCSSYSNTLSFNILTPPTNFELVSSTVSWNTVANAASYTISAYNDTTEVTYTVTTTSLTLDLVNTMFDGDVYLPSGAQYRVSVKANGNLGYASSEYSATLTWLY
ncbi:MAG: hypothetical protein AB7S44_01725 [Spirochaetales bacterium]